MSRDFQLITRERPGAPAFARAVHNAAGEALDDITMEGDFGDPNGYLSVLGYGLLIEIEPPGHVDAADLYEDPANDGDAALPEPDQEGCLWLTTAQVPAAAPDGSADVARRVFQELASRYDGVVLPG